MVVRGMSGLGLQIPLDPFSFRLEPEVRITFSPALDERSENRPFFSALPGTTHRLMLHLRRHDVGDCRVQLREVLPGRL
jgi:hypothetical protein